MVFINHNFILLKLKIILFIQLINWDYYYYNLKLLMDFLKNIYMLLTNKIKKEWNKTLTNENGDEFRWNIEFIPPELITKEFVLHLSKNIILGLIRKQYLWNQWISINHEHNFSNVLLTFKIILFILYTWWFQG